jgi:anti-sigma regulatory factor (Ser/Thr protein kinase)
LIRQQKLEAQARERYEQELRVARLIQQTLLPQTLPQIAGWQVWAYYQPARAVGGDFYDFLQLLDGRLAAVIGDVTDKGVPAALVMATVRSLLRAALEQFAAPGRVLEYTNEHLCGDIPPKMFVTCLVALINPATGEVQYANAGHDLPYRRHTGGVQELRATGMPLGLLPGMAYEERTVTLTPGDSLLLYSDGLVEAHNPQHEMFGFPRLQASLGQHAGGEGLIEFLVESRAQFVGPEWEQEDDTAIVILQRQAAAPINMLAEFSVPSEPGNERQVMKQVAEAASTLLPAARLEKLKTAVAEATMNAIEHGNHNRPELPVNVQVLQHGAELIVRIRDTGGGNGRAAATPDLDAKLEGSQSPRGWGLFLIEKMVDRLTVTDAPEGHAVELTMNLEGDAHV